MPRSDDSDKPDTRTAGAGPEERRLRRSSVTVAFVEHQTFLKKFLTRSFVDSSDIDDVAQETYLRAYIAAGRNLLIMGEPGLHGVMNGIGADLGVTFGDGRLSEEREDFPDDLIFGTLAERASDVGFAMPPRRIGDPVVLSGAGALRYTEGGAELALALERSVECMEQRIVVRGEPGRTC